MRLAFESVGCECVFSSDWDKFAQITYQKNFGEIPKGDIHKVSASDIPDHDILVGGLFENAHNNSYSLNSSDVEH